MEKIKMNEKRSKPVYTGPQTDAPIGANRLALCVIFSAIFTITFFAVVICAVLTLS
jgi:hypothetical protein